MVKKPGQKSLKQTGHNFWPELLRAKLFWTWLAKKEGKLAIRASHGLDSRDKGD
jgi:hypothetical protein